MTTWQLLQGLAMASVTPEDYILLIEQQRTALTGQKTQYISKEQPRSLVHTLKCTV